MKAIAIILASFLGVAIVVFVGNEIASGSDATAAEAVKTAKSTQNVLAQLHGGYEGDPFLFLKMCGHPDHFRNTPDGQLAWVYEQQRVLVIFMRPNKKEAFRRIAYNVYDPQRYTEWGEIGFLTPEDAIAKIGCSVPDK
jgi:hypothetical protein